MRTVLKWLDNWAGVGLVRDPGGSGNAAVQTHPAGRFDLVHRAGRTALESAVTNGEEKALRRPDGTYLPGSNGGVHRGPDPKPRDFLRGLAVEGLATRCRPCATVIDKDGTRYEAAD